MQSFNLHGREENGHWILVTPVDGQQRPANLYWQNGHQQIEAWVEGIAGQETLAIAGYHLTPEQMLRNAADNMQDGFGVVYAIHGSSTMGMTRSMTQIQSAGWRGVLSRILGS